MKDILFTPVGSNDPISNHRDGAMLQICRHYHPSDVYVFLSAAMAEKERNDHRYTDALKRLQEAEHFTMNVHVIEKNDLEKVYLFDTFYSVFEPILNTIHEEHPDERILVNISSGTPAMKSALNMLATLSSWPMKAVQVTSPKYSGERKVFSEPPYDVEESWNTDLDNNPEEEKRCSESENPNLRNRILVRVLERFLDAYDYNGAYLIGQEMKEFLSDDVLEILKAAEERMELDDRSIRKISEEKNWDFLPTEYVHETEYLLMLRNRCTRHDRMDFMRGITPIIESMYELALKKETGLSCESICREEDGILLLDTKKLENYLIAVQSLKDSAYIHGDSIREVPISRTHLETILDGYRKAGEIHDLRLLEHLKMLRTVERDGRNKITHQIMPVSEEWIIEQTQMSSEDIMNLLITTAQEAGIPISESILNSYAEMNRKIKEMIWQKA